MKDPERRVEYLEKLISSYFISGMGLKRENIILVFDGGLSRMKLPTKLNRAWKPIALHTKQVAKLQRKISKLEQEGGREKKIKVQQRLIIASKAVF